MSRRIIAICLTIASAACAVALPVPAQAAKRPDAPTPTISRVLPMRVDVGESLTIRGKHFSTRRKSNTVVFRAPNGRSAFAKPSRASRTKLVVRVPAAVTRLTVTKAGKQKPTRLTLRVLARTFSKWTSRRLSPVVLGIGRDGEGGGGDNGKGGTPSVPPAVCDTPADYDADLLPNTVELAIGTNPCKADSDGDGMSDGWEFYAARDLNIKAVPYPGRRPFPNALDPSDASVDFDGDGLLAGEEYRAWRYTGSSFDPAKVDGLDLESPLGYSDGTKFSRASEVPGVPVWRSSLYGLAAPSQPFPQTYNLHGPTDIGVWRDDERDADGDGLANWLESARGPGRPEWWPGYWGSFEPAVDAWPEDYFGAFDQRPFASLDLADPDADGDTLLDGEDDQDNDDVSNIIELYETSYDLDGDGDPLVDSNGQRFPTVKIGSTTLVVNAFNPCAPVRSRTCDDYAPFD